MFGMVEWGPGRMAELEDAQGLKEEMLDCNLQLLPLASSAQLLALFLSVMLILEARRWILLMF